MPDRDPTRRRTLSAATGALVLAAVGCSGCGSPQPYPPDLTFPARDDRLVLRVPTAQPSGVGEPGKLDAELAAVDALGGQTVEPAGIPAERRQALDRFLADTFGTPAAPAIAGEQAAAEQLGLTADRLTEGGKLYRRHCLQCHGLTGDGRGPTGQWIYPHPRDFRRGAFKFVSTGDGGKPRKSDLARTLRDGLKGTAMPAFGLLPEANRDLMAAFVTYLSLRGQVEFQTLAALASEDDPTAADDVTGFARERLKVALSQWEKAEATPPGPPAPPVPDDAGRQAPEYLASVRRGYDLFTRSGGAGCATCHEDFGRKATFRYDVWGTVVRPADLTAGGFKGGDDPAELYQRVRGGIQPSGMPAHPALTDAQVWDVVRFVKALPFQRELPPDVRGQVYPHE